jgi:hypothetical protein
MGKEQIMNNTDVVAKFTWFISQLNCITLGIDTGWALFVTGTYEDGTLGIRVDCSDKFWFATGDCEGIWTEQDLDLFIKIVHWFLEENYNKKDWYKKYYPTFEDYIISDNDPNYCLSNEDEEEMCYWLAMAYCMVVRGYEVHPHYWVKCPEWLKNKLKEAGVEAHPYNKKEEK